jgi:hypothetical protein
MYRSCIFCSAPLGSNDSIERFPVGRSLAFDAEKGRLWAVCGRCARWNLAPIEERWEAIEDAERLFRDTRLRVQSENIGLTKLPDGTRLVRVGRALDGELAVWRYGRMLRRRRMRYRGEAGLRTAHAVGIGLAAGVVAASAGSLLVGPVGAVAGFAVAKAVHMITDRRPRLDTRPLVPYADIEVTAQALQEARFAFSFTGEVSVEVDQKIRAPYEEEPGQVTWLHERLVLPAAHARAVLRRGMVALNAPGAPPEAVRAAVSLLAASGSAEGFLHQAAVERLPVHDAALPPGRRTLRMLALEMAVHDELERDAMQGELSALEEAWRQAEEIAGIADRLPDIVAEPPRLGADG